MDFPQILFNNPFRILDLYAEASLEQIKFQGRRLKAAIGATGSYVSEKGFDSLPYEFVANEENVISTKTVPSGKSALTSKDKFKKPSQNSSEQGTKTTQTKEFKRTYLDIDRAVEILSDPKKRILFRLFWFTGESALDRRGIKMLEESGLDEALAVWKKIYDSAIKKPTDQQISFLKGAYQNASVALMFFGKISEAVSLITNSPFKWVDFEEIATDTGKNANVEASDIEVRFTRDKLLQRWYSTILASGNIAEKLGHLGPYGPALQKAAADVFPLTFKRLGKMLVECLKQPRTMTTVVEAITSMMPIVVDLRYLQVIPQKDFFSAYLTPQNIETFVGLIDTKVFDYVITGPTEIKETDALTMDKFRESVLQCAVALDIIGEFVNSKTDGWLKDDFTSDNLALDNPEQSSSTRDASNHNGVTKTSSTRFNSNYPYGSKSPKIPRKTETFPTPIEGLENLRSILSPYIERLYDLYSNNLSKLVKQPQRVFSTTTQKKISLEYGAPLLLTKNASVWYEYKFYCDCYPQGRSYQTCLEKFTEGFYRVISSAERITPWESYILLFPQSEHVPEIVEKINTIRKLIAQEKVEDQQRQKAESFNSVNVLIAYYSQNPEACTNAEVWSKRALELAQTKADYRQIAHVFGKDKYGKKGSEQYRSILKKEQVKISQAIVFLVFAAFLGLIVYKLAELGMIALGFGFNHNAEFIGALIAIAAFTCIRLYLRRRDKDTPKNDTIGFFASFLIGIFSCVALWSLIPGQVLPDEESDMIKDTIHDYFNPPTDGGKDLQEDRSDRV